MRRIVRRATLLVLVATVVAAPTVVRTSAGAQQHPESAADIPVISVLEATELPIDDEHVTLAVLPAGYAPPLGLEEALKLAFEQLGPAAVPTGALVYLGTGPDGKPVWVVTYEDVCGSPNEGQFSDDPACFEKTLSVALDAATGEFVVAW
jgi:hypothetical protein